MEEFRETISASDIKLWAFCPKAFYFQKIQNLYPLPNEKTIKGQIIHKLYALYFEGRVKAEDVTEYDDTFLEKIEETVEKFILPIENLELNGKELVLQMKESIEKLIFRVRSGFCSIPKYIERTFQYDGLVARPDCIFEDNNEMIIGDVKLNRNDGFGTKLQLATGAILLEKEFGKVVTRGFIIDGEEWNEEVIDITDDLKKLIWDVKENILNFYRNPHLPEIDFNPIKCNKCSFKHLCKGVTIYK